MGSFLENIYTHLINNIQDFIVVKGKVLIFLFFSKQLHIVHIKEPYSSLAEAQHDMAGIALLAFLFEVIREEIILNLSNFINQIWSFLKFEA